MPRPVDVTVDVPWEADLTTSESNNGLIAYDFLEETTCTSEISDHYIAGMTAEQLRSEYQLSDDARRGGARRAMKHASTSALPTPTASTLRLTHNCNSRWARSKLESDSLKDSRSTCTRVPRWARWASSSARPQRSTAHASGRPIG